MVSAGVPETIQYASRDTKSAIASMDITEASGRWTKTTGRSLLPELGIAFLATFKVL